MLLKPVSKSEEIKILWGTTRSILNNAIIGVSVGHEKILEMSGVGFRASLKGNILISAVGQLNRPKIPNFYGKEKFSGKINISLPFMINIL